MAATVGSRIGGRHAAQSEVNVTPFVDVMLVLLIIFMVAAPLATVAVPIDLADINRPQPPIALEPVFVSLQDDGAINIGTQSEGEIRATWATLEAAIRSKTAGNPNRQLLIRADQKVPYSEVMRLMDVLQRSGYRNKSIVTEDVID
ncbi:MAG: biopolymer transporter ExbD [Alphaproteobacteria bacterium]|nr:biopolymer transporter ExbD [Alphaproteobacteria bacterium]